MITGQSFQAKVFTILRSLNLLKYLRNVGFKFLFTDMDTFFCDGDGHSGLEMSQQMILYQRLNLNVNSCLECHSFKHLY
jgi:hypothetical protein